jgi:D-amino-acid dehydrogenase
MESKKEVLIIGGGVIGLACAHYLLEKGAKVRIIEKDRIGDGASHGNCGLLYFSDVIPLCSPGAVSNEIYRTLCGNSPLYIKPNLDINLITWLIKYAAQCRSTHMVQAAKDKYEILNYSIELFEKLLALENIECDFEKKGLLTVFKDLKKFNAYKKTNAFLGRYNLESRQLEKKQALEMEPALSPDIVGAWYNKSNWHLRPELLMASWRKHLAGKGLVIEEHCKMIDFEIQGNIIKSVNTIKGRYSADTFIMATGAWAPQTAKQLDLHLPVQPGKGYSITMERPGICPEIPCLLYEKSMVVTPWKSAYRLGGTMEFSGYSSDLNPKRLSNLLDGAALYMKEPIGHPIVEEWTSLRPMTYDDMPIIDHAPSQENLIIATGHGMLGLTLATGTGKLVTDMVYGKTPDINIKPFGISRF